MFLRNLKFLALLSSLSLVLACGSAVEFGEDAYSFAGAAGGNGASSTLGLFQVQVVPLEAEITFTPVTALGMVGKQLLFSKNEGEYLAEAISWSDIQLFNGTTSTYDQGANEVRLGAQFSNDSGIIFRNNHSGSQHFLDFSATFSDFTAAGVSAVEGPADNGDGTYTLYFGDMAYNEISSRTFGLQDTDNTTYEFFLTLDATLSPTRSTEFLSRARPTYMITDEQISINGEGFDDFGVPVVKIGANTVASLDSYDDGMIHFTPTAGMASWSGEISVERGALPINTLQGPHIFNTSQMEIELQFGPGEGPTGNYDIYYQFWDGYPQASLSGCPAFTDINDSEILNGADIQEGVTTTVAMKFLADSGNTKKLWLLIDKNGDGIANQGDMFTFFYNLNITEGTINQLNPGSPVILNATDHGVTEDCSVGADKRVVGCLDPPCHDPGGEGDGTLGPTLITFSGDSYYTRDMALGDFNEDGNLDLISVNSGSTTRNRIYLGTGSGFDTGGNISSPSITSDVDVGDVNGDGHLDVVFDYSFNQTQTSKLLLGRGDGTFQNWRSIGNVLDETSTIALGDFNNDGILDVIIGGKTVGANLVKARILIGNGNGSFQTSVDIGTSYKATAQLTLGDINNDGNLDFVTANNNPSVPYTKENQVFLGNGDGTFSVSNLSADQNDTLEGKLADFNEDGNLDFLAGNYTAVNRIYLGNGDGTFQAGSDIEIIGHTTDAMAIGDFNFDGHLDIVEGNFGETWRTYLYAGNGDGTFQTPATITNNYNTRTMPTGDINGDGNLDVVLGNNNSRNYLLLGN